VKTKPIFGDLTQAANPFHENAGPYKAKLNSAKEAST